MTIIVSPSFLKQEAKKLKKNDNLPHHQALDEVSKKLGYSNFKHFLNFLEKSKSKSSFEKTFKCLDLRGDTDKKIELEIPYPHDSEISFQEQLNILKMFQHQDDIQSTCQRWNLMKQEIQSELFKEFITEVGDYEIRFRHPYYIADKISLSDLWYEIKGSMLCINGDYDLRIKFEGEVPEEFKNEPHVKNRVLSGSFEIKINDNKEISIPYLNIIEIFDGIVYAGTLKPIARLIPEFRLDEI